MFSTMHALECLKLVGAGPPLLKKPEIRWGPVGFLIQNFSRCARKMPYFSRAFQRKSFSLFFFVPLFFSPPFSFLLLFFSLSSFFFFFPFFFLPSGFRLFLTRVLARGTRIFFEYPRWFLILRVRKDKGFQKNTELSSGVWHFFDLEHDFQNRDFWFRISTGIRPRCRLLTPNSESAWSEKSPISTVFTCSGTKTQFLTTDSESV